MSITLTAGNTREFLSRFARFGDAVIREVQFTLRPALSAVIHIQALDQSINSKWVEVDLCAQDVKAWYWDPVWKGSFECGELCILNIDNSYYVGVTLDADDIVAASDFTQAKMAAYIQAKTLSYTVHGI